MSLEPIGIIVLIAGLSSLFLGYISVVQVFIVFTVLGSAAAILIGAANIQPAHLFLAFVALATLTRERPAHAALTALAPPRAGFWLMCLVLYGVLSAVFMPRLFAETLKIIPLGVSPFQSDSDGRVPLSPVSSNFTQSVYLLGDLLCFMMIVAIGANPRGFRAIAGGLVGYAAANIIFALLDVITSATGTEFLLQFIRNAQYTFHDEEAVGNLRRIIGSWPEASAFAGTSLGALACVGTLWICGRYAWSGILSLVTILLLLFSTSSTGLVGTAGVLLLLYGTAMGRASPRRRDRNAVIALIGGPLLVIAACFVLVIDTGLAAHLWDYVDLLVFSKSTSDSGLQRAFWNYSAWENFVGTWGLGVGLGTNRTSSFPMALLSNVGVPGTLFFLAFLFQSIATRRFPARSFEGDVQLAARNGCLGLLVGALVAGPTVDLGLLFFVFGGAATAEPAGSPGTVLWRSAWPGDAPSEA